jgi:hypothetical protein
MNKSVINIGLIRFFLACYLNELLIRQNKIHYYQYASFFISKSGATIFKKDTAESMSGNVLFTCPIFVIIINILSNLKNNNYDLIPF